MLSKRQMFFLILIVLLKIQLQVRVAGIAIGATFYFSHKSLHHFIYTAMSGAENQVAVQDVVFQEDANIDNLSDAVAKVSLQPDNSSSQSPESVTDTSNKDNNDIHSRPFVMYSRHHLLLLHKSPLVCAPTGMPALKDWFGFVPCFTPRARTYFIFEGPRVTKAILTRIQKYFLSTMLVTDGEVR
jgi:hypothetical protein